ncbi:MAG: RNA polymerase sigma factor SigJ [Planctomycetota bacterium]
MFANEDTRVFEDERPRLLGLAYRILGTRVEAEDVVQEVFLKWASVDRADIHHPPAWLTTVCTRCALDALKAAHRTRVTYTGSWLPEPIQATIDDDPARDLELASSLTTAFLLVLERLTPKERAAYLLREVFGEAYAEIAEALELEQNACRKLVSRAKNSIEQARVRHTTTPETQQQLLEAFQDAVATGRTDRLAQLLADDVRLSADGGGKVPALLDDLLGKPRVLDFVGKKLSRYWADFRWRTTMVNGGLGGILESDGLVVGIVSFAFDPEGCATGIYIVRNPDKVSDLEPVRIC